MTLSITTNKTGTQHNDPEHNGRSNVILSESPQRGKKLEMNRGEVR